jgi:ketosteroid isomerase-like protein
VSGRSHAEIVRGLFAGLHAFLEGTDPDDAFSGTTPDFEWVPAEEVPGHSTHRGSAGFAEFIREWVKDFETWTFDLERLEEAPDGRVVALAYQKGTGKTSGAPVELHFGVVFEFEDGLARRARAFLDPADALRYAGVNS